MYKYKKANSTSLNVNTSYEAENLEKRIERITNNGEPITDTSPLIYTERKDGVLPDYNIRTDRFEHAIDAMDRVDKMHKAKRAENLKNKETKTDSQNTTSLEKTATGGASAQDGTSS